MAVATVMLVVHMLVRLALGEMQADAERRQRRRSPEERICNGSARAEKRR